MYTAAAGGYVIDWAVTGVVSVFMAERGRARIQDINKAHEALKERWGHEVAGNIRLDAEGFPIEEEGSTLEEKDENKS